MAVTWSKFREADPALADFGKDRLQGRIAYLATIRRDGSPRVHPVSPIIAEGHLFVYMEPTSPKAHDLRRSPGYMLHCGVEDNEGGQGEFLVAGHAFEIGDAVARTAAFQQAKTLGMSPQERYVLFELRVAQAMATLYDATGPKRTKWKSG